MKRSIRGESLSARPKGTSELAGAPDRAGTLVRDQISSMADAARTTAADIERTARDSADQARREAVESAVRTVADINRIERELTLLLRGVSREADGLRAKLDRLLLLSAPAGKPSARLELEADTDATEVDLLSPGPEPPREPSVESIAEAEPSPVETIPESEPPPVEASLEAAPAQADEEEESEPAPVETIAEAEPPVVETVAEAEPLVESVPDVELPPVESVPEVEPPPVESVPEVEPPSLEDSLEAPPAQAGEEEESEPPYVETIPEAEPPSSDGEGVAELLVEAGPEETSEPDSETAEGPTTAEPELENAVEETAVSLDVMEPSTQSTADEEREERPRAGHFSAGVTSGALDDEDRRRVAEKSDLELGELFTMASERASASSNDEDHGYWVSLVRATVEESLARPDFGRSPQGGPGGGRKGKKRRSKVLNPLAAARDEASQRDEDAGPQ